MMEFNDGNKERLPGNGKEPSVRSSTEYTTSDKTLSSEDTTACTISSGFPTPADQFQDSAPSLARALAQLQTATVDIQHYANQGSSSIVGQHPCPPLAAEHQTSSTSLPAFVAQRATFTTPQSTNVIDYYTPTRPVLMVFEPVTNSAQNNQDLSRPRYTISKNPDGSFVAVNTVKGSIPSFPNHSRNSQDVNLSSDEVTEEFGSTSAEGGISTETNNASSEQSHPCDLSSSNSTTADETQTLTQHKSFIHFSSIPLGNHSTNSISFPQYSANNSDDTLSDPACSNYDPSSSVVDGNQDQTQCTDPVPPESSDLPPVYPAPNEQLKMVADRSYEYEYKDYYYGYIQPLHFVDRQKSNFPALQTCVQDPTTVFVEQQNDTQEQEMKSSSHLEEQVLSSPDSSCQYQTAESTFLEEQASSSLDSSLCQYQTAESILLEEQALSSPDSSSNLNQGTESKVLEKDVSSSENVDSSESLPKQQSLLQSNALGNAQKLKFEREKHSNGNLSSAERSDINSSISESNLTDVLSLSNSLNDIGSTETFPLVMNKTAEQTQVTEDSGAALDSPDQKPISNISREKGATLKTAPEFLKEDRTLNEQTSEEMKQSHSTEKYVQLEETEKDLDITTELAKTRLRDENDLEKVISPLKESEVASGPDVTSDNPSSVGASYGINLSNTSSISTKINVGKKESELKNDPNIRKKSSKSAKRTVLESKAVGGAQDGSKAVGGAQDGSKAVGGAQDGSKAVGGAQDGSKDVGGAQDGSKAVGGAQDGSKAVGGVEDGSKFAGAAQVQNALKLFKQALIAGAIHNICSNAKNENTNDLKYEPEVPNVSKKRTETLLKDVQSANNVSPLKPSPPRHESKMNANSKTSKRQTVKDRRTRKERNKIPNSQLNNTNLPEVTINMGASVIKPPAGKITNLGNNLRVEVLHTKSKRGMEQIMFSNHATTSSMSARVAIGSRKIGQPTQKLPDAVLQAIRRNKGVDNFLVQGKDDSAESVEKEGNLLKETKDNEPEKEDPKPELEPGSAPSTSRKKKRKNKKK